MREDGKFTRLNSTKIELIRRDKLEGFSLSEISKRHNISKSTASLYTRDLFYYSNRLYQTEKEFRESIAMRTIGKSHVKFHPCMDCGKTIRNEYKRCKPCHLVYQELEAN